MTMLFCIAESKIKAIHTYIQLPSTNPRRLPVISSACIIICASLKPCVGHVVRWKIGISNVIVEGEREGERKRGRPNKQWADAITERIGVLWLTVLWLHVRLARKRDACRGSQLNRPWTIIR